ncbi:hypothetical protein FA13DRAFT_1632807, partial [Coprinellus micaceus]
RLFASNGVVAKARSGTFCCARPSSFDEFLLVPSRQLQKVKKASGKFICVNVVSIVLPSKVKGFGIWLYYNSCSGTHNMYKEFRELSFVDAVEALYRDTSGRDPRICASPRLFSLMF